jgi:hypothetical protein
VLVLRGRGRVRNPSLSLATWVAELTIRGNTVEVRLRVAYLGEWQTPFWVGHENRGTLRRIGFEAKPTVRPRG